jgi:hypothetical protein
MHFVKTIHFNNPFIIDRQATPHNIHAVPSSIEEEELESEFLEMKVK